MSFEDDHSYAGEDDESSGSGDSYDSSDASLDSFIVSDSEVEHIGHDYHHSDDEEDCMSESWSESSEESNVIYDDDDDDSYEQNEIDESCNKVKVSNMQRKRQREEE